MTVARFQSFENLAIAGMDAAWNDCDGLDAFERQVYQGAGAPGSSAKGAVVSSVPLTALIEKVARGALADAGIDLEKTGLRLVALFACGQPVDLRWAWAERIIDLSMQPNPLAAALEQAETFLSSGQVDAVLFAACANPVDMATEAVARSGDSPGFGFDREIHTWRSGEGAGAVLLMPRSRASRERRKVYAEIQAMASSSGKAGPVTFADRPSAPALEDVRGCCRTVLEGAGVALEKVGYLETFACGVDALDAIEIAGIVQAYRQPEQDLTTALGSVQAHTGYLGAAAGLAGLMRAALCLYHRYLPGAPGWSAPKLPALWRNAPFYVPLESRPWFEKTGGPGRVAGLNSIGLNGSCAHLIMGEAVEKRTWANHALAQGGFFLFPLVGENLEAITASLQDLQRSLQPGADLSQFASQYYEIARQNGAGRLGLAILGHDYGEIAREIELALKAVPAAFEKGVEWQTPAGSYFTPQPAGRLGEVALVYPGAFNSYPGVGKDLFRLFPDLHAHMAGITTDLRMVMHERLLYPRSLAALTKEELAEREAALLADPIAMLITGTALTILYTHILGSTFGIHPAAAFGYSLGENSMMYATGVWGEGDQASARLAESDAFRIRLAGPQQAIREYWGLPTRNGTQEAPLWSNYLVMTAPEKVQEALVGEQRVYLTHVNTPRQVVIGGDPEACKRVLSSLRSPSLQAPFDYALHCAPMRSEYGALAYLHNWPVEHTPDLRMYSAADYEPVHYDQAELSQKMAHMLTTPLDFPRLVRKVYADGARVFIEAGAGSNCARWIDETLKGQPHLAISMDRRGTDDYSTLVRTIARLHSHRVPVNLAALYAPQNERVLP